MADAPATAIEGLSEDDAEKLQQAFNIKTVRDLAENKFVRVARAVVSLALTRDTKQTWHDRCYEPGEAALHRVRGVRYLEQWLRVSEQS